MPSFRWPETWQDVALAKEVVSVRPTKPADWEAVAKTLSASFSTEGNEVSLKGRGCKERMDLLMRKYKQEDTKALKR